MSSLFFAISRAFPQKLIIHLAARLGESENGLKRALQSVLPIVMGGMARQAEKSDARLLFERSSRACHTSSYGLGITTEILGILGSGDGADSAMTQGEALLVVLFGNAWQTVAASVSRYAQVKHSTARTLLTLVGAVLPGLLGQYAERHRLSAVAVTANLIGIKNQLNTLLPFDLRVVAGSLGLTAEARPPKQMGLSWAIKVISWTLVLMAALGVAGTRNGWLAGALPAASEQLIRGYLRAARVAVGVTDGARAL